MGGSAICGAAYAVGVEPVWIETTRHELVLPRLPRALDGYTVVQLSDLHTGPSVPRTHLARAVAIANAERPDLIVVTGDLVDDPTDAGAHAEAAAVLSDARARDGVFAVAGNHDTGVYHVGGRADGSRLARLETRLAAAGVDLLDNASRSIRGLRIAGFGDLWSGGFDARGLAPGPCTIALSHNPDTAPELARRGADLVLCGHTHGGQIDVPLFGPPWMPIQQERFLKGHVALGDRHVYVNRGLGWTHRIRFRARPEVTVLRLRAAASHRA